MVTACSSERWVDKLRKAGHGSMPPDLVECLLEEIRTTVNSECADVDGWYICPLCPNRRFTRGADRLTKHYQYHKEEIILGGLKHSPQLASAITHMHRQDSVRESICEMTASTITTPLHYLNRSAELIRSHSGVNNVPNQNGWKGVVLLEHDGPRLVNTLPENHVRISRHWYATPGFLMIVASFCDIRSQSKYKVVHDHVVSHFIASGSPIALMVPQFHKIWESMYNASVSLLVSYKEYCMSTFTYRVVSLDSGYKYMLPIVGQAKHGQSKTTSPDEIHCAHVLLADRTPISCQPGYAEGVPELSEVVKKGMTKARRDQAEIFLVDTPAKWTLKKVRALFVNVHCLAGDPLHVSFNVEKFVRFSSQLARDCRVVFHKFAKPPASVHQSMQYYNGESIAGAPLPAAPNSVLDRAYARLHSEKYREKAYLSHKQYCVDILAVKKHNAKACLKRARRQGTVGQILDRAMGMDTFGYFVNIAIYKAKTGLDCQFGTTPNEAIMRQLKGYNANVFTSTPGRAKVTLELFCFARVLARFMRSRRQIAWPFNGSPSAVCEITFAMLREVLAAGTMAIPDATTLASYEHKRAMKRLRVKKRPASQHKGTAKRSAKVPRNR